MVLKAPPSSHPCDVLLEASGTLQRRLENEGQNSPRGPPSLAFWSDLLHRQGVCPTGRRRSSYFSFTFHLPPLAHSSNSRSSREGERGCVGGEREQDREPTTASERYKMTVLAELHFLGRTHFWSWENSCLYRAVLHYGTPEHVSLLDMVLYKALPAPGRIIAPRLFVVSRETALPHPEPLTRVL